MGGSRVPNKRVIKVASSKSSLLGSSSFLFDALCLFLCLSSCLLLSVHAAKGWDDESKWMDFKSLRTSRWMSLRDPGESSTCTMTLDARGTYGCYAKANERPRRGKIVRGDTEEALNALAMMDDAIEKKKKKKDESVYVVTVPMTMMKPTLEKVKSGELKASGVLVEHPLAFIEDSRAVVAAEKEAAESGFYRGVPESDAKEDARRVKIGETPVAFLGVNATKKVVWAAEENVKREKKMSSSKTIVGKDELLYASMNAAMDAAGKTKEDLEHANSITCLKEGSCLPIGGYSIATAFLDGFSRYLYNESAPSIFVTARLDKTASMFRDEARGANAVYSSLISFLVAAEVVNDLVVNGPNLEKPIVFAAFAGEEYDLVGSKRMMEEFPGLVDTVVEIGPVGFASSSSSSKNTLYVHEQYNQTDDRFENLLKAQSEANRETLGEDSLSVKEVSRGVDVPKGSSLNSFTNVSGSRLTLTDYNTFESDDPFYGTMFDSGLDKIDAKRIAEVARLIAGAALRMSMKDKEQFTLKTDVLNKLVDSDFVQHTIATAAELAECFVDPKVGLRKCSFSQKYDVFGSDGLSEEDEINETNNIGSSYVGVVEYIPEDIQTSEAKSPIQRFVYEHLSRVANGTATTTYRLALPSQLKFDRDAFTWQVRDGNANGYEIWTESNWSTKLGVTLESNKGWYFEPIATACAVVIATLFCFLGERTLERALTGGSMNPFSSSSSQKRSGIDLVD